MVVWRFRGPVYYVCDGNKTMEVVYINTTAGNSYAVINQMDEMIPMQLVMTPTY
ncbi:hypothetical protein DZ11F45_33810 [Escherichia coli]